MPAARPILGLLAALSLAQLPTGAVAQAQLPFSGIGTDRDAPVELSADSLEVDQAQGTALFTGDVLVIQGDLRLSALRVRVDYATDPDSGRNRIARINADGAVVLVTPAEAAEGDRAVYDLDSGEIVMEGSVVLTQAGSALAGDRLVIDLDTSTGRMEGRVRSVILPDSGP
jgi:lipopolysaccharide export system protein LptA